MFLTKTFSQKLSYLSGILVLSLSLVTPLSTTAETMNLAQSAEINNLAANSPSSSAIKIPDGTYLYGQSDKPEQIGEEYIVFQVQKGKVIGAFYMPQSEFSCFSGVVDARHMKLSIIDPYDNTVYPYAIALESASPIANANGNTATNFGLEGYQELPNLSNLDRHILGICLNEVN